MNVKKQLLLLVALVVLLIGAASATDLSNDTIGSDMPESIVAETSSPEEVAVEEKSTPTMDVEKNTAEQKINKITRDKKSLKTASSYDVETYQELRDALTNINDEYITVNIKDNIKLEDYILIESNRSVAPCIYVTINGEGNTIDGDHQHYFLNIAQNVMVTINNLTVNNCTAAPSLVDGSQLTAGGAIINRDTLILNNTRFNNNHAELYGGAIWNYDNLIVDNSEFNNNTAHVDNLSADGVGQGGAIYGGSLIVNNTVFNNNRAYTGGAISVNRYLIVDNTEFNNNTAESAGAIHTSCTSTLTNTVFNNNVADSYGGAISNGGTLTVNNTQFNNNTVHGIYMEDEIFGWMMSGGGGGAISNGGTGNLTVTDTEFNNNHADNYGGAIDTTAYSNLTVTNSRFNCNTADWWGGAIYYLNASESAGLGQFHPHGIGSYNIADTTFYNNTPANFIIDQDNYIELKENDNYINVSNIAIIVDGEEIYNAPTYEYAGGEFDRIAYCEIPEGNHLVKLIVNGTNIINNEYILSDTIDVTYQGLIDVIEGATMDMTLKLEEGLSYNMLETITLDKPGITITIDGNGQTINGMQNQVFRVNSGSSLVLKNITITNARSQEGGAIYNEGNLTIIDSTLTNNQATAIEGSEHAIAEGGAIYNKGNLTIIKSTLTNNQATATESSELANAYGGAISNRDGSVTIIDSTLTNNQITAKASGDDVTVNAYGGAISNFYGSVTITDTTLNSNSATATGAGNWNVEVNTFGGAIYNTETLTITDSTLENNNVTATATAEYATVDANALGAATYNDEYSTYNITGTTFYKNAPANIIINETTKKIELINDDYISIGKFTIIADGKEIGNGKGIDNLTQFTILDKYKNVEIVINGTDGKTLNNRYILRGFSVEVHNYTELVEAMEKAQSDNYNSYIINLLPGDYNATKSIIWEESETKNIIINANGVTLNGKGLYQFIKVGSGLNLKIENITLTNYRATNGGAIENHGTLNVTDSTLTNNTAQYGGAINNTGTLNITDSILNNNTAQYGGAIYNNGNLSITHSTLSNNTANATGTGEYSASTDALGGAIYNLLGSVTITDSTLNNNQVNATATGTHAGVCAQGGAIYNDEGTLNITQSTLNNNTATSTETSASAGTQGGAIYNLLGNVTITDSTLTNNTVNATGENAYVKAWGGAIYNFDGPLTITQSIFTNNQANATTTMTNGPRVSAEALGGVIYNNEGTLNITQSTFTNNSVNATARGENVNVYAYGGVIYDNLNHCYITDTTFYKNAPANFIINETSKNIQLLNKDGYISIVNFTIKADGKVIGTGTNEAGLAQFTISDEYKNVEIIINGTYQNIIKNTFNNHYVLKKTNITEVHNYTELIEAIKKAQSENYDSFIINLKEGDYNATESINWEESSTKNLIINGNNITLNGKREHQFIKIGEGLNLTLNNITITNYTANYGGAIRNEGTLTITHTTLQNNTAYQGGVIDNMGILTITHTTLQNNTARECGGAIQNNYGTLNITHTTLQNNTARECGGAIHNINGGKISISYSTLNGNVGLWYGGAISDWTYSNDDNRIVLFCSNFTENVAGNGAVIYNDGSYGKYDITYNQFRKNTADDIETLYLGDKNRQRMVKDNTYDNTDVKLKTINLTVMDEQLQFTTKDEIKLNFTLKLEHWDYYDEDILEKLNKTLYINDKENVTTNCINYTLSNLKLGKYSIYYTSCNQQSNPVTFKVMVNSEITTPDDSYDYYDGVKNTVILDITDPSGEKGTADIRVKDDDNYRELIIYNNVKNEYTFSTETLKEALKNLYNDELGDSYTINVTYSSEFALPSSTEFTLNIIKQRNTTINYNIINNTEGNVQINITVQDDIYRTPVPDAVIKITGDINQNTTTGVITDTTLTPGDYTINVQYEENTDYKAFTATIDFTVEIDKDKKISELENNITNLTNQLEEKQKELKEANEKINTLNETNKNLTRELEEANEQTTALTNTITDLNNEIKTLNDTVNSLTEQLKNANNKINSLNNTNNELTKDLEDANKEIETLNNIINNLTEQLNDAKEEIENLNKIIDELINKKPLKTTITINPIKSAIGEITTLTANIVAENGDKVTGGKAVFKVNGITLKDENNNVIYATVTDGTASISYKVQDVWMKNTSTVQAVYGGTEKYAEARTNASDVLDISKGTATITLEKETITAKAGQTLTFKATVLDANSDRINTGKVVFKLNGKTLKDDNGETLYAYVKDGQASIDYTIPSIYSAKTYTLTAVYGGGNHERAETTGTLNLERKAANINTDKITTKNNKTTIKATITYETGNLLVTSTKLAIKINQKTVLNNVTSTNGKIDVSFTLPLRPGIYELTIISGENGLYKKGTMTTVLKI